MEPARDGLDSAQEVDRLRARLYDVASDLRPLPAFDEMRERINRVRGDLHKIEQELQLVLHVARLEHDDIVSQVEEIDRRLAAGWVPPSRPVDEVVEELRAKYG